MKISREDVEPLQVRLTVEVAPERLEAARRDVAQAYSKRYRIPGFRPGKVPPDRVAALIGDASLNEEAMEQLGREVLQAALKAEGLSSVAPVMLELLRAEPPTFVGTVSLEPQVELGDYRALRVPEPELPEVTDDDVDEMLERLRRDAAERLPVDRPSEIGDVATLNVKGWRRAADEADPEALDLEARPGIIVAGQSAAGQFAGEISGALRREDLFAPRLRGAPIGEVAEPRGHQRERQIVGEAAMDSSAVEEGAASRCGGEQLVGGRHEDRANLRSVAGERSDGDRPTGQPVQEVGGAVDRVDDPAHAARAGRIGSFLTDDCVVRACGVDPAHDEGLAGPVELGDHVGCRRLRGGRGDTFASAAVACHAPRCQGQVAGQLQQLTVVVARRVGRHQLRPELSRCSI